MDGGIRITVSAFYPVKMQQCAEIENGPVYGFATATAKGKMISGKA
jgi:hypothetical protein